MPDTLETHLANPRTPVERRVAELGPWFHNLHLPDGTQTAPEHPLGDFPAFQWQQLAGYLPDDLTGWRVLDLGCNAGYWTFALAQRGAEVTAIDVDERYLEQARWAAAQYALEGRITFQQMQVYALADLDAAFDLVLFLGLFYHLRYPLLALDLAVEKTRRLLTFQTLSMPGSETTAEAPDVSFDDRAALQAPGWPRMAFVENRLAGDPTNWWVPNSAASQALLRSSGLRITARPGSETYLCTPDPAAANGEMVPVIREQLDAATGRVR